MIQTKERLYGLDVLRIIGALMVCAFHTNIHLNANYGLLNDFISQGAMFMTLFFMLSGYSLFLGYSNRTFTDVNNLFYFFKKRFISIVPMYWLSSIFSIIWESIETGGGLGYTRTRAISN